MEFITITEESTSNCQISCYGKVRLHTQQLKNIRKDAKMTPWTAKKFAWHMYVLVIHEHRLKYGSMNYLL
jgi:hypothetical protein